MFLAKVIYFLSFFSFLVATQQQKQLPPKEITLPKEMPMQNILKSKKTLFVSVGAVLGSFSLLLIIWSLTNKCPHNQSNSAKKQEADAAILEFSKTNLVDFLAKPIIPEYIEELVKKAGKNNLYSKNSIQNLFGKNSNAILKDLIEKKDFSDLRVLSLEEISTEIESFLTLKDELPFPVINNTDYKPASFFIVQGLDVAEIAKCPLGKNSILQVASRCGYFEDFVTNDDAVESFATCNPQGQRASALAAASCFNRQAALRCGLPNMVSDENLKNLFVVQPYGYFDRRQGIDLDLFTNNKNKIKCLAQWVKCEGTGSTMLQVFSSCPNPYFAQISDDFVEVHTELIMSIAKFMSLINNCSIRIVVNLTLLGTGEFAYPPKKVFKPMFKPLYAIKDYPIDLFIHVYNQGMVEDVEKALEEHDLKPTILTAAEFRGPKPD